MSDVNTAGDGAGTAERQSIGDTAVNADPSTLILQYGEYKVPVSTLSAKALAYLLQNGFSQSMTDAAALTKEQKTVETGEVVQVDGKDVKTMRAMTDAELDAKVTALRDARFGKILAGEVGIRAGGPRGSALDTIIRQVATERLRVRLAKAKQTLPSGKNKDGSPKTIAVKGKGQMTRDELIEAYVAKNADDLRTEAERRRAGAIADADAVEELDDVI